MKDPSPAGIKAWAKEYDEAPFFFEQSSDKGKRLVAWTEDPEQMREAFYAVLDTFPEIVNVLHKISAGRDDEGNDLWCRYGGAVERDHFREVVKANELYVFSDGMHQLCFKEPETEHYLAFDEHAIFFVYSPTLDEPTLFASCGFENRYAEPIYSMHHFQHTPPDSEKLEIKFVTELGLEKLNSDLD